MATASDPYENLRSTSEKENFQRVARLLICGGTALLRDVFDSRCPPASLSTILRNPVTVKDLKKAKLTKPQWDCLYPSPGVCSESKEFDITLLFKLLRSICSLTPPVTGWDVLPTSTDHSLEADLARVKYYRNLVYGHVNQKMEIRDDSKFLFLWREISETLVRIAGQIHSSKKHDWQAAIDKFQSDPLTTEDERYVQELFDWYRQDLELKKSVEELRETTFHIADDLQRVAQGETPANQAIEEKMENISKTVRDVRDQLGELKKEFRNLSATISRSRSIKAKRKTRIFKRSPDNLAEGPMSCEVCSKNETKDDVLVESCLFEVSSLRNAPLEECIVGDLASPWGLFCTSLEVIIEEDFPEEIIGEQRSLEVTNRGLYFSGVFSLEDDIPETLTTEYNSSEDSSGEDDIPYEGDFEEDIHDEIIGAEVTTKKKNTDDASKGNDIPGEIIIEHGGSEDTNRQDDYHAEELSSEEDIPEEIMIEHGGSEVINRDDYHAEELSSEEDIPEEIMIEHRGSEVTNRDDYYVEELSSEEDIPEEIIVEDNCSKHSNVEEDVPCEGDHLEDIRDGVIGAEVTAENETTDVASEKDDIPEDMSTKSDSLESVVDNSNYDLADEIMEERFTAPEDTLEIDMVRENRDDEAVEVIEEAIYEDNDSLDDRAIESLRMSAIKLPEIPEEVDVRNVGS